MMPVAGRFKYTIDCAMAIPIGHTHNASAWARASALACCHVCVYVRLCFSIDVDMIVALLAG